MTSANDKPSLERERIIIEVGIISVTLLLGVGQFVNDQYRPEFLSFVSGIATCFIIAALSATVFMMGEDYSPIEKAIMRMCEFVPFFIGMLMLGAMFLSTAMTIPKYANVVLFAIVCLVVTVPIFGYLTHRLLNKEKKKNLQKTVVQ